MFCINRRAAWPILAFLILALTTPLTAAAEKTESDNGTGILVLGDSLGDGMYVGLYRTLRQNPNVKIHRLSKIGTGLFNIDMDAWEKKIEKIVETQSPSVAVVMVGGNDPQPIRCPGRERYAFRTEDWKTHYTDRVDRYMTVLKKAGLKVFWVGLPSMRDPDYDEDIQYLNDLYQERARENGITFIPTRDLTVDEEGHYTAYGPDLEGRRRLLRANDGKHFTGSGYEVLANRVLQTMESEMKTFEVVSKRD